MRFCSVLVFVPFPFCFIFVFCKHKFLLGIFKLGVIKQPIYLLYYFEILKLILLPETDDHGPINTWDRVPYLTDLYDGTQSLNVKENQIHRNFLINNYRSVWPIDHDDGSCFWNDTHNYLVYGGIVLIMVCSLPNRISPFQATCTKNIIRIKL